MKRIIKELFEENGMNYNKDVKFVKVSHTDKNGIKKERVEFLELQLDDTVKVLSAVYVENPQSWAHIQNKKQNHDINRRCWVVFVNHDRKQALELPF